MKNLTNVIMTALLAGTPCVGAERPAEVSPSFVRWMLRSPGATLPLPKVERDARKPVNALWSEQYTWLVEPSEEAETPQRLPTIGDEHGEVRFAAGAIKLALPAEWHVAEMDGLRHVRLYLTPDMLPSERRFTDGLFVTYHVRSSVPADETELLGLLRRHASDAMPQGAIPGQVRARRFKKRLTVEQPFAVPGNPAISGQHLLIATDWGVTEIQTRFSNDDSERRVAEILEAIDIGTPRLPDDLRSQADGAHLLGTWKAERARLVLRPDGAIDLYHDRQRLQHIEQVNLTRPARRLRGEFTTDGDVLHVTWEDGSQLNLRYFASAGELLLTDHNGRVSQLHRLLE